MTRSSYPYVSFTKSLSLSHLMQSVTSCSFGSAALWYVGSFSASLASDGNPAFSMTKSMYSSRGALLR